MCIRGPGHLHRRGSTSSSTPAPSSDQASSRRGLVVHPRVEHPAVVAALVPTGGFFLVDGGKTGVWKTPEKLTSGSQTNNARAENYRAIGRVQTILPKVTVR